MSVGSLGAGSGMDLESLVTKMVSAKRDAKVQLYQNKINGFDATISALGQVGYAIDNFKSSASDLNNSDLFTARNAKISQVEGEEVISIKTDETASNGSYDISVNQLAQGSRIMSAPGIFSSGDDVVTAVDSSLTFRAGDYNFSLDVNAGTTISELRNQINTSEENFGVSANLVDDGNGNVFFTMTAPVEGAGNTLRITNSIPSVQSDDVEAIKNDMVGEQKSIKESEKPFVDDLDLIGDDVDFANDGEIPEDKAVEKTDVVDKESLPEASLNPPSFDKSTALTLDSVSTMGASAGLYTPVGSQAQDAIITVDGIQIRSETNTFSGAVAGLSIEALGLTEEATKVEISYDKESVRETMEGFVSSYNDLINMFEQSTSQNAVLDGNSMIRNLQSSLSSKLMSSHGDTTGVFTSIFDMGVKMSNEGTLSFDGNKFDEAMKKGYSDVAPLMSGENGLAKSLVDLLDNYTGATGMTNTLKDSARVSMSSSENDLEAFERRMDSYEESLRDKFSGLDARLANMNAQGNYLNSVLSRM